MSGHSDVENPLLGAWRIERTDLWNRDDLDLLGEPRIAFLDDELGSLRVGALEAELDYRVRRTFRGWRARFSWSGLDDGFPTSGRGSVRLIDADRLRGTLHVHLGDTCRFRARRAAGAEGMAGAEVAAEVAVEVDAPRLGSVTGPRLESAAPGPSGEAPPSRDIAAVTVSLADVLDALEYPEEWEVFLDRKTGRIVAVTDEERPYLEEEEPNLEMDDLPDWLRSSVEAIRSVLETGDPVRLPDRFDVHEWSIMRRFADTCEEPERGEILDAIHGRGAFRSFRAATERLGLREAWFRYREEAFERIAREWAEAEGIRLA